MQSSKHLRLTALEEHAAQCAAQRNHTAGTMDRILTRLDAIGRRLREGGVIFGVDASDMAQRMATVKAALQQAKERYHASGY